MDPVGRPDRRPSSRPLPGAARVGASILVALTAVFGVCCTTAPMGEYQLIEVVPRDAVGSDRADERAILAWPGPALRDAGGAAWARQVAVRSAAAVLTMGVSGQVAASTELLPRLEWPRDLTAVAALVPAIDRTEEPPPRARPVVRESDHRVFGPPAPVEAMAAAALETMAGFTWNAPAPIIPFHSDDGSDDDRRHGFVLAVAEPTLPNPPAEPWALSLTEWLVPPLAGMAPPTVVRIGTEEPAPPAQAIRGAGPARRPIEAGPLLPLVSMAFLLSILLAPVAYVAARRVFPSNRTAGLPPARASPPAPAPGAAGRRRLSGLSRAVAGVAVY